ncbi:unnamed protein product [Caenorhabditis auriculariae]|uniref:Replication protein A subunit n=1 Tax=Caenorhabditis auriculariae TaxID=2777116 RepID=A0A8S1GX46_9PELO|nr:unnamed protein product [Caenorhabditis auriculariae]
MAAPVIDKATYEKYNTNGKLRLSTGFIQQMYEDGSYDGGKNAAIVQIVQYRVLANENKHFSSSAIFYSRAKVSDGVFGCTAFVFDDPLEHQCAKDDLRGKSEVGGEIIAIKKAYIHGDASLPRKDGGTVKVCVITDYQLLSRGHDHLSSPGQELLTHNGDKEVHRGYRPTFIVETDWPEAAQFVEAEAPAAKRARGPDGTAVGGRAPPPQPSRQTSSGNRGEAVTPIAMITPYVNKFRICGVCTTKEEIRNVKSRNGDMRIFNFELTDKNSDTIRLTAFNELAEQMQSVIMENSSYYIAGGTVRAANKRFNASGHDYEITLRNDSEVKLCTEEIKRPTTTFKIVTLDKIAGHLNEIFDVLAVVERVDPVSEFTSKAGKELVKREISVVDRSATEVTITLWGEHAKTFDENALGQVVGFKSLQAKEWQGGYSLGSLNITRVVLSPELEETAQLYEWHAAVRPSLDVKKISTTTEGGAGSTSFVRDLRFITTIQALRLGSEQQRYVNCRATITKIKPDQALYKACPNDGCQKKVVDVDGEYRCEKCATTSRTFKWNYMLQFEMADLSGQVYATAFSNVAQKLLHYDAQQLGELRDSSSEDFNAVFQRAYFKYHNFRLRAKYETYNEESRLKLMVMSVDDTPMDAYINSLQDLAEKLKTLDV